MLLVIAAYSSLMAMAILMTEDGSQTIKHLGARESYHSLHGALQESRHVFVESGYSYFSATQPRSTVRILEIGFGTGLNALLTADVSRTACPVYYTAVEPNPVDQTMWSQLTYDSFCSGDDVFNALHEAPWDVSCTISPTFRLHKLQMGIESCSFSSAFDVIYFDAFSPETAPELWGVSVFSKLFDVLDTGGVLVTYCSKGTVKQCLRDVGFQVQRLPGPIGKRHMVRAIK